ncbi:MAG: adenylate/guanylate cyclase domain-containing protein [Myxococcota bacterium]
MRRLRALDWILIGTLVPAWVIALALQLHAGLLNGCAVLPFYASSAPSDGYPRVDELWREVPDVEGTIARGDRVIRVGSEELRGVTATRLMARAYALVRSESVVPLTFERDRLRFEVRIAPLALPFGWWSTIPFALTLGVIGLLLLIRAPDWPLRRRFFVASLLMSIFAGSFHMLGGLATWLWVLLVQCVVAPVAVGITLWTAFEWTEASRPATSWQIRLSIGMSLLVAALQLWWNFLPAPSKIVLADLVDGVLALFFVMLLFAIAWAARVATPLERRQGRWIFFGFFVGVTPLLASIGVGLADLPVAWELVLASVGRLALAAIPVGFFVSIVAYHFLDIDRLIGASATYTVLGVGLLGAAFVGVPRVAESASAVVGIEPTTGQVVLSMLVAAVAVPIYRVARPWIDRLLVAERFAVDRGFQSLLQELPTARDAEELTRLAGERVTELLHPESCVLYSRSGDAFEPLFVRGTAVPPAFESSSPLIGALAARRTPLVARRFSQRDVREKLSPFDRAALETLATAVVVPVRRREELVAFLSLGPKRSGDIYSPGDLTLLSAVAGVVSNRLERFEDAEVAREARAMQQELRRYVPGAVARGIESAESLEPREQAVSVLFMDIRGYATYAENRAPHEIFSTVNRYTTAVSAIVERHAGSVVEFNGDGMMAVFGAPAPLADKELAAVRAARAIVEQVAGLDAGGGTWQLSVGVGIATGSAFVGSVQAVDRRIWTALGNTTNLAARLQALTRELDALIVIDAATQRSAGDAAAGFERREQVMIRGRSQREDLYLLRSG